MQKSEGKSRKPYRKRLCAMTLSELLILMIISGILFLSIMEGVSLFQKGLNRMSKRIDMGTGFYGDYDRLERLVQNTDSIKAPVRNNFLFYKQGELFAQMHLKDSALILRIGSRTDTLFSAVSDLETIPSSPEERNVDTMVVTLKEQLPPDLTLKFAVPTSSYQVALEVLIETEKEYTYDE